MTRSECASVLQIIFTAYPRQYAGQTEADRGATLNLWAVMFAEDDYKTVSKAVMEWVAGNVWPPAIAEIRGAIRNNGELSAVEAWALVTESLNCGRGTTSERFELLPVAVKSAIGSASVFRSWGKIPEEKLQTFIAKDFKAAYTEALKSARVTENFAERVTELLPEPVKLDVPQDLRSYLSNRYEPDMTERGTAEFPTWGGMA